MQRLFVMIVMAGLTLAGPAALSAQSRAPSAPASELIYFGTRINGAQGVIQAARFDPTTGALTPLGPEAHVDRPTWVLPDKHRALLYAVSETGNDGKTQGQVLSFAADPATGALTPLSAVRSGGGGATYLAIDRKAHAILVANYGTGQVAALPLLPDGTLRAPASVMTDSGTGPSPRQKSAHAHGIAIDPSGAYVLVSDLGADKIFIDHLDPVDRTLSANDPPFVPVKPGSGPRHIVFSRDGFVYTNAELSSELTTWRWDAAKHTLSALGTISTRAPGDAGENSAGEIVLSPSGRFLYATNRGEDSIVVYARDAATGLLHAVQRIASGGKSPWAMAFDATGGWLLVANEASGMITVFRAEAATGMLTATPQTLAMAHPASIAVLHGDERIVSHPKEALPPDKTP